MNHEQGPRLMLRDHCILPRYCALSHSLFVTPITQAACWMLPTTSKSSSNMSITMFSMSEDEKVSDMVPFCSRIARRCRQRYTTRIRDPWFSVVTTVCHRSNHSTTSCIVIIFTDFPLELHKYFVISNPLIYICNY